LATVNQAVVYTLATGYSTTKLKKNRGERKDRSTPKAKQSKIMPRYMGVGKPPLLQWTKYLGTPILERSGC
jgi:hypothetical protein